MRRFRQLLFHGRDAISPIVRVGFARNRLAHNFLFPSLGHYAAKRLPARAGIPTVWSLTGSGNTGGVCDRGRPILIVRPGPASGRHRQFVNFRGSRRHRSYFHYCGTSPNSSALKRPEIDTKPHPFNTLQNQRKARDRSKTEASSEGNHTQRVRESVAFRKEAALPPHLAQTATHGDP